MLTPVTAAIAAGDDLTGVSIMLLDEGLDTGPVLAMRETPIADTDTGGSLTDRLAALGAELLIDTLPGWLHGSITPAAQDNARATHAPRLEKDAGRVQWSRSAVEIWRQVRAYNPWPGAFTSYHGEPLRIHAAWPLPAPSAAPPGTVLALPAGTTVPARAGTAAFGVATGDGLLAPVLVQRAGRRPLPAPDFLRGERDLLGSRLGDVLQ
jgi:methionyl-tRNA formyltransferase